MLPQHRCRGRPGDQSCEAGPCHPLPAALSREFRRDALEPGQLSTLLRP